MALVDKGSGTAERGVLIAAGSVLIGLVYLSLRRRARIRAGGEH